MLKRLRIKFVCINMLIATAMLAVIFGMVFHFTRQNLQNESMRMLQTVTSERSRLGRPGQRRDEVRLPYFVLDITQTGEVLASGDGYDLSDQDFLREIISAVLAATDQTGSIEEYGLRYQRVMTPMGHRIAFVDMSSERNTLNNLMKTCALIGTVSLVVFFLISLFLARWAIKPVEQAWAQQRQFVADASHELKTPLTVILTNAELLQGPDRDEEAKAQFSSSILTMAHQMRGLVESLLELARLDSGTAKADLSRLDFSALVAEAILPFEPLYFEQGLEIRSQIEEWITVHGNQSHLRQVTEILLDNAMKYSTSPALVELKLQRQGRRCLLSVSNPGQPISPEDLRNIFKRFYRVDKARSMNHSYGLGLSIAENIVAEHKGRIWAESKEGINTFFVELPIVS